MTKKISMISFVLCLGLTATAQTVISFNSDDMGSVISAISQSDVKKDVLDSAFLECQYEYTFVVDTADTTQKKSDRMILQVGKKVSKYYSYTSHFVDSLTSQYVSLEFLQSDIKESAEKFQKVVTCEIFKDLAKNKLKLTDDIAMDSYMYEETIPDFNWQLATDTKEILGYSCRKAVCDFRGRQYTAWFTDEIPVMNGPWKFHGLPGLIMEVEDAENHYKFEIVGIKEVKNQPVTIAEKNYLKTSIKKYLSTLRKSKEDPISFYRTSGVNIKIVSEDGSPAPDPTTSMKYEFMEREDW